MVILVVMVVITTSMAAFAAEYVEYTPVQSEPKITEPGLTATIPTKRVAVINLQVIGDYTNGETGTWLMDLMREKLANYGWTIIARGQSYDRIIAEQSLSGIDPATKTEPNKLWGATANLELTARFKVNRISGGVGFNLGQANIQLGSYVQCQVDIVGKLVSIQTGQIKPITSAGNCSGALESLGLYVPGINAGGAIYNDNIRESLAWKAADKALNGLAEKLNFLYDQVPGQVVSKTVNLVFDYTNYPLVGDIVEISLNGRPVGEGRIVELFDDGRQLQAKVLLIKGVNPAGSDWKIAKR